MIISVENILLSILTASATSTLIIIILRKFIEAKIKEAVDKKLEVLKHQHSLELESIKLLHTKEIESFKLDLQTFNEIKKQLVADKITISKKLSESAYLARNCIREIIENADFMESIPELEEILKKFFKLVVECRSILNENIFSQIHIYKNYLLSFQTYLKLYQEDPNNIDFAISKMKIKFNEIDSLYSQLAEELNLNHIGDNKQFIINSLTNA